MISYLKLKNFKSLANVHFDFRENASTVKNFIAVYGENGSGKSNFVDAIKLIRNSLDTLSIEGKMSTLMELFEKGKSGVPESFMDVIIHTSASHLFQDARMIDCDEITCIEIGFIFKGHKGTYRIEFNDVITYEKLYYFTGKQSGQLFEIKNIDGSIVSTISSKMYTNRKVSANIEELIKQYWGKHTLLSILQNEISTKNISYITNNYSEYILDCIKGFHDILVHSRSHAYSELEIGTSRTYNRIENLAYGTIHKELENIIDSCERILDGFFTQAYADIKRVFYKKDLSDNKIAYSLYVDKEIGGSMRTIPFSKESAGTQHLLDIVRALLGALNGTTVVYDEIDNGIHDLLFKNIISSILPEIEGQLIITTHNTFLMESLSPKSVYIIDSDFEGNKKVHCLTDFARIQQTNNTRSIYMKGGFGGIPNSDFIDYDEIRLELSNMDSKDIALEAD